MRALPVAAALAAWMLARPVAVAAGEAAPPVIAVVVSDHSPVRDVTLDDLRELYLRRRRVWVDGRAAIPVNLPPDHPSRLQFSRLVLGRSPEELLGFWNARYFEGIMPPTVLSSPNAVRAYLAVEPDAIAYLPIGDVDATCRTVLVLGR